MKFLKFVLPTIIFCTLGSTLIVSEAGCWDWLTSKGTDSVIVPDGKIELEYFGAYKPK